MANEIKGFANLMRFCNKLEDYEQKKANGEVTDDVLVIVLEDKLIKFKGQTFDLSGEGSGGNYPEANVQAVEDEGILDDLEIEKYIKYVTQSLTDDEKAQARNNIGAITLSDIKIDDSISALSENAVQNKVIKQYVESLLKDKVDKVEGKQLTTVDFTTTYKSKLDSLKNISIDTEMSEYSNNPVQNKVIKEYVDSCFSNIGMPVDNITTGSSGNHSVSAVLKPNHYTRVAVPVSRLEILLQSSSNNSNIEVINQYIIEFTVYDLADFLNITLPPNLKWANGVIPDFSAGGTYIISIINNLATAVVYI